MEEKKVIEDREFDVVKIVKTIFESRNQIIKITASFMALGLLIALTSPKEWAAVTELMPESKSLSGLGGSLGSLAGLAGISLDEADSGIDPDLYPNIANSTPFLFSIASKKYYFKNLEKEVELSYYLQNHLKLPLLGKIISLPFKLKKALMGSDSVVNSLEKDGFLYLNERNEELIEILKERISVSVNKKTGVIKISVLMQDPLVSAQMAEFTKNYITNFVTGYYREQSERNLEFINGQLNIKRDNYNDKQKELALFLDKNFDLTKQSVQIEIERLRSEKDLAFNIYNTLAQQVEEAKINVQEVTPVFQIIEPVVMPEKKSQPKRAMILIGYTFLGFLISIMYVFSKNYIKKLF